jgi:hypothetical protein
MPARRACLGVRPAIVTLPRSGRTVPMIALKSVDLPDPFMPMSPQTVPGRSARLTSSRASTSP